MMLHCLLPGKLQSKKIIFEDVFSARDSATLEHLKELSSGRRVIEESINQSSFITEAIAREMCGGLTSHCLRPVERPPEATPSICTVMSLICLAEAQAVTIRKAEEKGTTVGLLEKLHYGIIESHGEATAILYSNTRECKDILSSFLVFTCTFSIQKSLEFMSSCKALHELRSLKYLAESLKIAEQLGVAIGVLRDSLINAKKEVPQEESWSSIFGIEIAAAADMLRKFEHENEFVWHEKIPTGDELPWLQRNKIVNAIPYNPKRWERELSLKI